jgi:aminotransferase
MGANLSQLGMAFPGSRIRKMFAMAAKYQNAVNLALGEPNFPTPEHIVLAAAQAIADGDTHYTVTSGRLPLREAIADKVRAYNKLEVDPADEIIVTIGAVGAIALAMMATVDPGQEVLIPDPAWPNYAGHVMMAGARPVRVPLREAYEFKVQLDDLEESVTARTRALVLNTPHSPTGAVLSREEVEGIASFALRHDLIVITDEVYQELIYDGQAHVSIGSLPEMWDRTVTITSFSKSYAMTGWRIGYALARKEIVAAMTRLQECSASCPTSMAQTAALAALRGPQECVVQMRAQYDRNRRVLVGALNELPGVHCVMPRGAFYAFPSIKGLGGDSWQVATRLLEEVQVVAVPGSGFGPHGEGYLRFSLAASSTEIDEAVARLRCFAAAGRGCETDGR